MGTKDSLLNKTLAEITEEIGYRSSPPEPPVSYPHKWLPRFIAKSVRLVLLPFVFLDQGAKKIARFIVKPPFQRIGSCKKRGNCCYAITMRKRKGPFEWFQRFWMFQVHNFFPRSNTFYKSGKYEYYLLGCKNLQEDGSCAEYSTRPIICRDWPIVEIFGYPKLLKGCGYWFFARKKEYANVVSEYEKEYEKKSAPLPLLNDAVFYVDDPVSVGKDS